MLVYDPTTGEWIGDMTYLLDKHTPKNGGWVGLKDITYTGVGDNPGGHRQRHHHHMQLSP